MKIIRKLFLTMVMCGLLGVSFAHAQIQKDKEHKGKRSSGMFEKLNLTGEQRKQLKANKQGKREEMKASFEKMKSLRQELKQELMKPELDMNKINSINDQLKSIHSQMADRRIQSILEVRKILTPEQFSQFISTTEKHHDRWKNKKHEQSHKGE